MFWIYDKKNNIYVYFTQIQKPNSCLRPACTTRLLGHIPWGQPFMPWAILSKLFLLPIVEENFARMAADRPFTFGAPFNCRFIEGCSGWEAETEAVSQITWNLQSLWKCWTVIATTINILEKMKNHAGQKETIVMTLTFCVQAFDIIEEQAQLVHCWHACIAKDL